MALPTLGLVALPSWGSAITGLASGIFLLSLGFGFPPKFSVLELDFGDFLSFHPSSDYGSKMCASSSDPSYPSQLIYMDDSQASHTHFQDLYSSPFPSRPTADQLLLTFLSRLKAPRLFYLLSLQLL